MPERLVHERVELRFDRDQVWVAHRGQEVARYRRSYEQGVWLPPSQFEAAFLGTAHGSAEVAATLAAAKEAFRAVQAQ